MMRIGCSHVLLEVEFPVDESLFARMNLMGRAVQEHQNSKRGRLVSPNNEPPGMNHSFIEVPSNTVIR